MMKFYYVFIFCFLFFNGYSQQATWTNTQQRNIDFPIQDFLKGYAHYTNHNNETQEQFLEKLKGYAQKELLQGVRTTIGSASVMKTRKENDEFSQLFIMSSIATSNMRIEGLQFETYYDKKTKIGYAFAYANRTKVLEYYSGELLKSKSSIQQKLDLANNLTNQQSKKLKQLNSCFLEFRTVEQTQCIMFALRPTISEDELLFSDFTRLKTEVENLRSPLEKSMADNISEAAVMIAMTLKDQLNTEIKAVRLVNLSYEDTKMGSSFSRRFSKILEQKLTTELGLSVLTNVLEQDQSNVYIYLNGTYWKEGNSLRIIVAVKDIKQNKTLASAETKLSLNFLSANSIKYKPDNFQQAYANMKVFKTDELTEGGLLAEIWTNKGDENLVYTEGDKLKLFFRVNGECFLRIIYYLADGSKVLLFDNYYISSDNVNNVYQLPEEFECSEPFGVETIQINAQTKLFEPLNTENMYGYEFISDNLSEILVSNRGFKNKTSKIHKAENRVVITTMKK